MAQAASIASSSDANPSLELQIVRAAEQDNVAQLKQLLEHFHPGGETYPKFLRIALLASCREGRVKATIYLLEQGAPADGLPGDRQTPIAKAVEHGRADVVEVLVAGGANIDAADKKGRTLLMTAAWKNHVEVLRVLIRAGADVNACDDRRRNVLHNLGADRPMKTKENAKHKGPAPLPVGFPKWGDAVIKLLLEQQVHLDEPKGLDETGRTPLHWACATGKVRLAEMLLERSNGPRAAIEAADDRGKTSLHLAATHDQFEIVLLLLRHGANFQARTDGGWTALHCACDAGSVKIVKTLLEAGAEVNERLLLSGSTPLHIAAQKGRLEVVRLLLSRTEIRKGARDLSGISPFLQACQKRHRDIMTLLAPFNNWEALSQDAIGACKQFNATIIDFGNFKNTNSVERKCTVFDLLYAKDSVNPLKPAVTVNPRQTATDFRWIHLPANNLAWIETLLTKWFIEDGSNDVEGFQALEKSFTHQHRGKEPHSHFMRPLCQGTPSAPMSRDAEPIQLYGNPPSAPQPTIIINGVITAKESQRPGSASSANRSSSAGPKPERSKNSGAHGGSDSPHSRGQKKPKGAKNAKAENSENAAADVAKEPKVSAAKLPRPSSTPKKDLTTSRKGNLFAFMPYLHFETTKKRQAMQEAIKQARRAKMPLYSYDHGRSVALTKDEMLIRAHLNSSTMSLHVRRTLDQSFYHNIDTENRDLDQVVYRYQQQQCPDGVEADPKIFMVDQLWMWVLSKNLVVTSFPQRWDQPKQDPLNVLESIVKEINSKAERKDPVNSVYDLAITVTERCSGTFDRHHMGDQEFQFLDVFESSIGSVTDRESDLFQQFKDASRQASSYLRYRQRPHGLARFWTEDPGPSEEDDSFTTVDFARTPQFVDKLLDIGAETNLLAETKDIRDELNMISKILEDQKQVVESLKKAVIEIYADERRSQQTVSKRFDEQLKMIDMHINDIRRMDKQAERIYSSITDMLDLKQKHANAIEARFARDQAAGTNRQSQTIMVFTIVTIIFLPLSFIAAFFTINIQEFPGQADPLTGDPSAAGLPLGYVSKYMFGIGFAVSIPLVFIALNLDNIESGFAFLRRRYVRWRREREARRINKAAHQNYRGDVLDDPMLAARGASRSARRTTADTDDWDDTGSPLDMRSPRLSRESGGVFAARAMAKARRERDREVERAINGNREMVERQLQQGQQQKSTGFRMRISADIERGYI